MPGVLVEVALEDGLLVVRPDHRRLEVVQHDPPGDSAEELPGVLQALDEVRDLLPVPDPDEHVPAVDQHHHQGVELLPPPGLRVA
jgi:hypothetical protein